MLIYIPGMSSTGKTTLLNRIRELSEDGLFQKILGLPPHKVEFIAEFTRSVFKQEAPAYMTYEDLISHPRECLIFQQRVAEALKWKMQTTPYNVPDRIFICDRAPIDYRINLMLNYNTGDPEWMKELEDHYRAIDWDFSQLPEADFTFMTNPYSNWNKVEYDGFRPEKYAYRRVIEEQAFKLASAVSGIRILPDGVDDRVGFIIRSIILKG